MQINTDLLKNKQRILIGGNDGAPEIYELTQKILNHINKPADLLTVGEDYKATDAPIVLIKGGDELVEGQALFHQLDIHILLVHKVTENIPQGYSSFEQYLAQWEKLADALPKAGSFIYFEEDNVATMMGKKEREDVKNIEYARLKSTPTEDGLTLKADDYEATLKTGDEELPAYAGAAKALLNRIGVSDEQFFSGLKAL